MKTKIIEQCADRAHERFNFRKESVVEDLTKCIEGGCDLDLERLLVADDFNFFHDISGIAIHLDPVTGKLDDMFLPRFTKNYGEFPPIID